ncbi:hypothetical protein SAMN05421823_11973 [Catalinimonas alkaloidigena]|uniref:Uncharacterized protein n=1 Tax=Catalinimonas alkaloidigena TaxID=1075417 RepID=A0A1G9VBS1_9BACT|nr:hypothetical protein [Catalinimonas alkaloidigena]SDM69305.1 hypothetical protein SAMN05421823_11973 [Catalinimonas alkaloidigena]
MSVAITGTLDTTSTTDVFPTHDTNKGKGGLHHVLNIAARNAIPKQRREDGMVVTVKDRGDGSRDAYQLVLGTVSADLMDNGNFVLFNPVTAFPTGIKYRNTFNPNTGKDAIGTQLYANDYEVGTYFIASQAGTFSGINFAVNDWLIVSAFSGGVFFTRIPQAAGPATWDAIAGKPTAFTPASHGHPLNELPEVVTALQGRVLKTDLQEDLTDDPGKVPTSKGVRLYAYSKAESDLRKADLEAQLGELMTQLAGKENSGVAADLVTALKGNVVEAGNTLEKLYALIQGIQTLLTSDDANLDEIQEIVTYIKANQELIQSVTTSKENKGVAQSLVDALLAGVPAAGNTLNKLYVLIQGKENVGVAQGLVDALHYTGPLVVSGGVALLNFNRKQSLYHTANAPVNFDLGPATHANHFSINVFWTADGVNLPTFAAKISKSWDNYQNQNGVLHRLYFEFVSASKIILDMRAL